MHASTKRPNSTLGLPTNEFPYSWANDYGEDDYGIWVVYAHKDVRYTFRWITPGSFMMGSPANEPERNADEILHKVTLTKGFWLGETPVTQALWNSLNGKIPSRFLKPDLPIDTITWYEANEFIRKINRRKPRLGFRLPSEAEWEYACRSGTTTSFCFGNKITEQDVNCSSDVMLTVNDHAVKVYELPCNNWGLYQMHGNVFEWCNDWYGGYETTPSENPIGPRKGEYRIMRGGSWTLPEDFCRSACRSYLPPGDLDFGVGFRLAMNHSAKLA